MGCGMVLVGGCFRDLLTDGEWAEWAEWVFSSVRGG